MYKQFFTAMDVGRGNCEKTCELSHMSFFDLSSIKIEYHIINAFDDYIIIEAVMKS